MITSLVFINCLISFSSLTAVTYGFHNTGDHFSFVKPRYTNNNGAKSAMVWLLECPFNDFQSKEPDIPEEKSPLFESPTPGWKLGQDS